MTKRLFQVLLFTAILFATAQLSAQSFPSVAPPPGTTTYSSLPALPATYFAGPFTFYYYYNSSSNVVEYYTFQGNSYTLNTYSAGQTITSNGINYTVSTAPTLPSGYSYTPTGQILTPSGATVDSFSVGGLSVPFDGGMSLVLLASGIGYASKRMKAKKATAATV